MVAPAVDPSFSKCNPQGSYILDIVSVDNCPLLEYEVYKVFSHYSVVLLCAYMYIVSMPLIPEHKISIKTDHF